MSEEERVARAQRAKQIMEDPLFKESMMAVETNYVTAWKLSKTEADREYIHAKLLASIAFMDDLRSILVDGAVLAKAAEKRERQAKQRSRYKSRS
jgi:hypothetical protein